MNEDSQNSILNNIDKVLNDIDKTIKQGDQMKKETMQTFGLTSEDLDDYLNIRDFNPEFQRDMKELLNTTYAEVKSKHERSEKFADMFEVKSKRQT